MRLRGDGQRHKERCAVALAERNLSPALALSRLAPGRDAGWALMTTKPRLPGCRDQSAGLAAGEPCGSCRLSAALLDEIRTLSRWPRRSRMIGLPPPAPPSRQQRACPAQPSHSTRSLTSRRSPRTLAKALAHLQIDPRERIAARSAPLAPRARLIAMLPQHRCGPRFEISLLTKNDGVSKPLCRFGLPNRCQIPFPNSHMVSI